MAKVALSGGFSPIPEGTHVFQIVEVNYKEEYGKLEVKMKTANGKTHLERFSLMRIDGSANAGALSAFSFFAKTALQDFNLTEIDHNDLVGRFIKCVVEHNVQPSTKDPSKDVVFTRLGDKYPADGFEEGEAAPKKSEKSALDLDALLG